MADSISFARGAPSLDIVDVEGLKDAANRAFSEDPAGTAADVVLVFRRSTAGAPQFDVSLELTAEETLTSPLLPGFALPVGAIFQS